MTKQIKTIVIILVILVAAGGLYRVRQWNERKIVNGILNAYNVENALNSGSVSVQEDSESVGYDASDDKKTPEQIYDETREAVIVGKVTPFLKDRMIPVMETVYGKIKLMEFATNALMGNLEGSFGVTFKAPRIVKGEDLGKLSEQFVSDGFTVVSTSIESNSGSVMMMKGQEAAMSIGYEGTESQNLKVVYWEMPSQQ